MAELSEIDRIRKKRRRKIILARALLLVALTLAGVGLYLIKDSVSNIHIGSLVKNAVAGIAPGPGFPVDFDGEVKGTYQAGRCLVVLTDTNLVVYNPNGKRLRDIQHKYSDPVVRVAGQHILIFDRGGKWLRVESPTESVAMLELKYPIYACDISIKGDVAVVTGEDHYNARLAVYDRTLVEQEKFVWKSPDRYIVDVSFTPDGNGLSAGAVNAQGGDIVSSVRQYQLNSTEMTAETVLRGELLHSVRCVEGGMMAVTDARCVLLLPNGSLGPQFDYRYETLAAFARGDDGTVALIMGDYHEDKTGTLILIDQNGTKLWERKISSHTSLLCIDRARLGLVTDGKLIVYDGAGKEMSRHNLGAVPLGITLSGRQAYVITPQSIEKLVI